ncbi:MAG: N-acetylneuraminate synthase family protein [Candidatus Hodarchaeota archaeon]
MKKRPIEIIFDIGQNFNGRMTNAANLIKISAECGADAVKFQLYDPRKRKDFEIHPYKNILLANFLTKRKLYHLKEQCELNNIEFLCSVFDVDKVDWLEQVGVERYKVGSKSFYDVQLRERLRQTGKPVILSHGMAIPYGYEKFLNIDIKQWEQTNLIEETIAEWNSFDNIRNLYCVSNYPTTFEDIKEDFIFDYGKLFIEDFDGFSDHTEGISASLAAMSRGANIIEKHITMDKTQEGPDHRNSIEPSEMKLLCKFRDDIEKILY